MKILYRILLLLIAFSLNLDLAWGVQDVLFTVHNLSTSGPGTFKSLNVSQVCVFCHTPHSAQPTVPLWNRNLPSGQTYDIYGSSTLQASPDQPSGKSRLCLSCHDGTVALGDIINLPGNVTMDLDSTFLSGRARLGTDLRDDHPLSFLYDINLANADGEVDLCFKCHSRNSLENDESGFLHDRHFDKDHTCINCHDPHGSHSYNHLINFKTYAVYQSQTFQITGQGAYSEPTFIDGGEHQGMCYLVCHGEVHPPRCYDPN